MAAMRVCCVAAFSCFFCLVLTRSVNSDTRPRGVAISKTSFYDPSRPFTCLDGSKTVEFSEVNDDYCDCPDGTDEPGTAACSNGIFHCTNAGHRPQNIPSSKVNDGICDCCDTTDEYEELVRCTNNCKELGLVAKEERKKDEEKQQQGFQMRSEYSQSGKEKKQDREDRKNELQDELNQISELVSKLEAAKKETEEKAEAAKQEHISRWKAEKEANDKVAAEEAFNLLDTDQDGILTVAEIQAKSEFDKDLDGVVSPEEAQEYLNQSTDVSRENFYSDCWSIVKDVFPPSLEPPAPKIPAEGEESTYEPPAEVTEVPVPEGDNESPTVPTEESVEDTDDDDDHDYADEDDNDDQDDNDDDVDNYPEDSNGDEKPLDQPDLEGMPEFDDETKALIEAAESAAAGYRSASDNKSDKEGEMSSIEKDLELNLGEDQEFYPLQGHCYEFTDREYTYSLCPFDKVTQKSKNGGRETTLGNWGEFAGEKEGRNKYRIMLYTAGEKCWNGPDRQAKITLKCGVTNELVSASELNRCEYAMDFLTPAVCKPHLHEEL